MASNLYSCLLFFFLVAGFASSSDLIPDGAFDGSATGRALLQAKKSCSVSFEYLNYSVITDQCKGPKYAPSLCCGSFKQLACPYAEQLNDLSTDCASTLFSYINLYGKYPPGLFAYECREGKEGLICPALAPESSSSDSASRIKGPVMPLALLTVGFLVLKLF